MGPSDTFARPSFGKVLLSFLTGTVVGVAFVLPAIRADLTVSLLADPGPIGNVVMIGVLAILVVTTGLFGLYRLFWLVDK